MNLGSDSKSGLLYVGFNQDFGCFACGTDKGFMVYNCDPLKERFHREFEEVNGKVTVGKGIGIVEMLFRCNILVLVGGGKSPKYPPNKVSIWDDYQGKCIAELEFRSDVKAVRLRRDRIVVALENRVYVYNFQDLSVIDQFDTYQNPKGLLALCPSSTNTILATLGEKPGQVVVRLYDYGDKKYIINAHENSLSQIALNLEGTIMATASEKGTLVRLFNPQTGDAIGEFRRGALTAEINNLSFSPSSHWLCATSDKGTVHIYSLTGNEKEGSAPIPANNTSSLSFMKNLLPSYFSSVWSCAQFHIPETRCICTFSKSDPTSPTEDSIIVICANGKYYKYSFDPIKKEAKQQGFAIFFEEKWS